MRHPPPLHSRRRMRPLLAALVSFAFLFALVLLISAPRLISTARAASPNADLQVTVHLDSVQVLSGTRVHAVITLTNNGPDAAAQTQLKVRVPSGMSVLSATAASGQCSISKAGAHTLVQCAPGRIAPGGSVDVALNIKVATGKAQLKLNSVVSSKTPDANAANNRVKTFVKVSPAEPTIQPTEAPPAQPNAPTAGPFVVNSNGDDPDASPGNGFCLTASGACTLRAAIMEANAFTTTSAIDFSIPVTGSVTINVGTGTGVTGQPLPGIISPVTIDGTTAPAFLSANRPVIVVNGTSVTASPDGLFLDTGSDGSTIKALVLNGFSGDAIHIQSDNNTVQGNCIGTDQTCMSGVPAEANGFGIVIASGGSNNLIGGSRSSASLCDSDCNVIANSANTGVQINGSRANSTNNSVTGNFIGVVRDASAGLANGGDGIEILGATANFVGGVNAGEQNLISGNGLAGVLISGSGAINNEVRNNFIGTDSAGTGALPNQGDGISVDGVSSGTTQIGGTTAAERNVISGNGFDGIALSFTDNNVLIEGNYIGVGSDGTTALGNKLNGIHVAGSSNNTIGSLTTSPGACNNGCNVIAHNGAAGVRLNTLSDGTTDLSNGDRIVGNSIFSNAAEGILLASGNNQQPAPTITLAQSGSTIVSGQLTTVTIGVTYRVEIFDNTVPDPGCDTSGSGEGKTFIGSFDVLANTDPQAFSHTAATTSPVGSQLTGTATNLSTGDTSQFSTCIAVAPAPTATPTDTATETPTPSATLTPTDTPTATNTSTPTSTRTPKPTKTFTPTSATHTVTPTPSLTKTHTPVTPTETNTPHHGGGGGGNTATFTPSATLVFVTNTPSPTSATDTPTLVALITLTPTDTPAIPTDTQTPIPSVTETTAPTITPAILGTITNTPDATGTSASETQTAIAGASGTPTESALVGTGTPTLTPPASPTGNAGGPTPTPTPTPPGGSILGVGGGFPLLALGGLADYQLNWWVLNVSTPVQAFSGGLAQALPNLVLAILLAVLFGFFGNLQSDTLENHEEEVRGWLAPILRPLQAIAAAGAALDSNLTQHGFRWVFEGAKLLLILFGYGLIFSFLDPSFSFSNPSWLLLVVAVMLSVGLVSLIDDIAKVIYSRRLGGGGTIDVNGANFGLSLGSMVFSRFAGLAPGIIFGSAASARGDLKGEEETLNIIGLVAIGITAILAWFVTIFVPQAPGSNLWFATLFILIFAVGLQTLFFELVPVYGTMGDDFFKKNRILWLVVFVLIGFIFLQTQLNPQGNFISAFTQANMRTLTIIVIVFCVFSGGLWLYFWLRDRNKRGIR